jgi:predicted extracellular nuclease
MEIGLAAGTTPLVAPTEEADAQTGDVAARTAYNNARGIVLDDGSSANYTVGAKDTPMPWITKSHSVRVGADATFTGRVVLDYRNWAWKIQPTTQVTGVGADTVTFAQTRAANLAPADVGGDLKLGTFNVLNYFNTTGQAWVASGGGRTCSYFTDRERNPITVNSCNPNGPRGAARAEDFARQQAKIVEAINTMDADVVSLEEIENSIALGETDRDDALSALVAALNADAGTQRWAFAASPAEATDPANVSKQDVIRTAFIYDPSTVELVGESDILFHDDEAFSDAREPLAQAFKAKGADDADAFGVIANHFKSKGSGTADPYGQGNANDRRILQAESLVTFADQFKAARGISRLFLTGDFNAYSAEDPVQELEAAGYHKLESDTAGEYSYSFSGLSGSLDHVFANDAALADVRGVDIWDINAGESIAYQYSRYNYNVTDFWDGAAPWSASDHNPEIVGIAAPVRSATSVTATAPTLVYGTGGDVTVSVDPSSATGEVTLAEGSTEIGSATLSDGTALVAVGGTALEPGQHVLTATYAGDAAHKGSSSTVMVTVEQATPTITASASPATVKKRKGTATITVEVAAAGFTPTGRVGALVDGRLVTGQLGPDGVVRLEVGPFPTAGKRTVQITYAGDGHTKEGRTTTTVTVVNGNPK